MDSIFSSNYHTIYIIYVINNNSISILRNTDIFFFNRPDKTIKIIKFVKIFKKNTKLTSFKN